MWLIIVGFVCSAVLTVLNALSVRRVAARSDVSFPLALPIVPWVINVYCVFHIPVSWTLKVAAICLATLIEVGVDVVYPRVLVQRGSGALHRGARRGDLETCNALLGAGADVNSRDSQGWSPVELAAIEGHKDVVAALARAGADLGPYHTAPWGRSRNDALGMAASEGRYGVVKMLVEEGWSINDADEYGYFALRAAIRERRPEMVDYLLRAWSFSAWPRALRGYPSALRNRER